MEGILKLNGSSKGIAKWIASIFVAALMVFVGSINSLSQDILLKPTYSIYSVAWHPNGELLAVGMGEGVKILDENLQLLQEFQPFIDVVTGVAWNSDGTKFAAGSGYEDGRIVVWEFDNTTHDFTLHKILDSPYNANYQVVMLKWNPDDGQLGVLGVHRDMILSYAISIYDTTGWTYSKREIERTDRVLAKFVWNPDGTKIAVTGRPDQAYIYIIDTLTMLQEAIWFSYIETDVLEWTQDNYLIVETPYSDYSGINLKAPFDARNLVTIVAKNANFGISFLNNAKNALVFFSSDGLGIWDIYTSR